jgi:hypothetical protein
MNDHSCPYCHHTLSGRWLDEPVGQTTPLSTSSVAKAMELSRTAKQTALVADIHDLLQRIDARLGVHTKTNFIRKRETGGLRVGEYLDESMTRRFSRSHRRHDRSIVNEPSEAELHTSGANQFANKGTLLCAGAPSQRT